MYIIRPVDEQGEFIGNLCKIGETQKDVNEYISQDIYPKNPFKLEIVSKIKGSDWETVFHIRYNQSNVHHEWFTFDGEMLV